MKWISIKKCRDEIIYSDSYITLFYTRHVISKEDIFKIHSYSGDEEDESDYNNASIYAKKIASLIDWNLFSSFLEETPEEKRIWPHDRITKDVIDVLKIKD